MLRLLVWALLVPCALSLTSRSSLGVESQVGRQLIFDIESKMTCLYENLLPGMQLKLNIAPWPLLKSRFPMQMRLTSPSTEYSEWAEGDGEASLHHNVTEEGDYEICLFAPRPIQISLNMFFHDPVKVEESFKKYLDAHQLDSNIQTITSNLFQRFYNIKYSIRFYNTISVRDEAMQQTNRDYIQVYSIVFSMVSVILAISQVTMIRRMFRIDTTKIRI